MRILIADDDFTSRRLLMKSLEGLGDCDAACNGKEAWEAFVNARSENHPYGLVLLDMVMPEMDGREVLKRIRDLEAESGIVSGMGARIAMATVVTDRDAVIGSFRYQCDGYIRKPYTRDSLLGDLRRYSLLPPA